MPFIFSVNGVFRPYPYEFRAPEFQEVLEGAFVKGRNQKKKSIGESVTAAYKSRSHRRITQPVYAERIMSSPVQTLTSAASVEEAKELLQFNGFRHIPILSENKLVGMLSDRDLLRINSIPQERQVQTIGEVMTSEVLTATRRTRVQEIAEVLFHHKISALPILNEEHELVGILTVSDILKSLLHLGPLELWV